MQTRTHYNEIVKLTAQIARIQIFTTFLLIVSDLLGVFKKVFFLNISSVDEESIYFIHITNI